MSKRIVFSFDDRSFEALERFKETGQFSSLADAVRTSLIIARALQEQARFGFTQVITRNENGDENILVVPPLA